MFGLFNRLRSTYHLNMTKNELFALITDAMGNVKRNQKYNIAIGAFLRLENLWMCAS